jgi:hypothetical protein
MGHHTEAFVGIDTSKIRNAIAIADSGRGGEVRYPKPPHAEIPPPNTSRDAIEDQSIGQGLREAARPVT